MIYLAWVRATLSSSTLLVTLVEGGNNQIFKVFFKNLNLFKLLVINCENIEEKWYILKLGDQDHVWKKNSKKSSRIWWDYLILSLELSYLPNSSNSSISLAFLGRFWCFIPFCNENNLKFQDLSKFIIYFFRNFESLQSFPLMGEMRGLLVYFLISVLNCTEYQIKYIYEQMPQA